MESYSQVQNASLYGLAVVVAGWLVRRVYNWINPPCDNTGMLPPGSMGFPLIGETFQLFKPSPSLDIPTFYKQRLERYGSVFKTSLMGKRMVVSMDAEVNRFIFQQEGKLFRSWFPDTTLSIFGKDSIASYESSVHKYVRGLASRLFGLESLKADAFLAEIERNVAKSIAAWATQPSLILGMIHPSKEQESALGVGDERRSTGRPAVAGIGRRTGSASGSCRGPTKYDGGDELTERSG